VPISFGEVFLTMMHSRSQQWLTFYALLSARMSWSLRDGRLLEQQLLCPPQASMELLSTLMNTLWLTLERRKLCGPILVRAFHLVLFINCCKVAVIDSVSHCLRVWLCMMINEKQSSRGYQVTSHPRLSVDAVVTPFTLH
jgi:hypothetical protein